jgi:hypothetical protein
MHEIPLSNPKTNIKPYSPFQSTNSLVEFISGIEAEYWPLELGTLKLKSPKFF